MMQRCSILLVLHAFRPAVMLGAKLISRQASMAPPPLSHPPLGAVPGLRDLEPGSNQSQASQPLPSQLTSIRSHVRHTALPLALPCLSHKSPHYCQFLEAERILNFLCFSRQKALGSREESKTISEERRKLVCMKA